MLEQVGKAGEAWALVLAAHVVPDVDRHQRRLAVLVQHHAQAVVELVFLIRNAHLGQRRQRVGDRAVVAGGRHQRAAGKAHGSP